MYLTSPVHQLELVAMGATPGMQAAVEPSAMREMADMVAQGEKGRMLPVRPTEEMVELPSLEPPVRVMLLEAERVVLPLRVVKVEKEGMHTVGRFMLVA